ncbi:hypothetical protein I316_07772 [Kwoniella heveanensis BCC8398]|uniref:Uncharacterized protein n=1 Tax=Kwoniella heveanensis BCC8398 TaxID=1296120 RepID=A0A1B9GI02_9TREE|nr:hypothetical protein I316_07772 [Kwoniella heveanensis BCC8398]
MTVDNTSSQSPDTTDLPPRSQGVYRGTLDGEDILKGKIIEDRLKQASDCSASGTCDKWHWDANIGCYLIDIRDEDHVRSCDECGSLGDRPYRPFTEHRTGDERGPAPVTSVGHVTATGFAPPQSSCSTIGADGGATASPNATTAGAAKDTYPGFASGFRLRPESSEQTSRTGVPASHGDSTDGARPSASTTNQTAASNRGTKDSETGFKRGFLKGHLF